MPDESFAARIGRAVERFGEAAEKHPWAKKAREVYYGKQHRDAIPEHAKLKKPTKTTHMSFFGLSPHPDDAKPSHDKPSMTALKRQK